MPDPRNATAIFAALVLLAIAGPARAATVYRVGPGQPYATPSDVPWESLAAGDSVLIHARPTPYRDKWVICRVGTPDRADRRSRHPRTAAARCRSSTVPAP